VEGRRGLRPSVDTAMTPICEDRFSGNGTALAVCCPQQIAWIGALSAFTRVCDALWRKSDI
jgi:hypothetical protein